MYFCSWFLRGIHLKAGTSHDFSKFSIGSMYIVLEKKGQISRAYISQRLYILQKHFFADASVLVCEIWVHFHHTNSIKIEISGVI
jgi:hypothetical protein